MGKRYKKVVEYNFGNVDFFILYFILIVYGIGCFGFTLINFWCGLSWFIITPSSVGLGVILDKNTHRIYFEEIKE